MLALICRLNGLFILLIAIVVRTGNTCARTDFYCYYIKEYHPNCPREDSNELIFKKVWTTTLKEESSSSHKMASNGVYRPRSALARAFYEKQRNDRHLQEFDKNEVSYLINKTLISKTTNIIE